MFTGTDLQLLRTLKRMKQGQIGKAMRITQQAVSQIEKKSHLSAQTSAAYLRALNLNEKEAKRLLQLLPPPPPQNKSVQLKKISATAIPHKSKFKSR